MGGSKTATGVWKVVYVAPHHSVAEAAREALVREGFYVLLRPVQAVAGPSPIEVLVPRSEAVEATRILQVVLGRIYGCDDAW
ncbi:MAG: glutamate decarboxylase [Bacillota bacterium]|nr:glutamate decarboxylase [Bacillota bacterium]